ncbi:MAG: 4-hydroxybenzoate octaprenyltransferase [Bacteroidetes bacterium 4572_114]|nr:MAG: 4-hydroxybenzoate octaprenyltransferase [Bacteroidetes bacterium 4572_114]
MLKKLLKKSTNYLSLVKFAHTVFALPFALIGFSLAIYQMPGEFSVWLLLQVLLCMVFARNAAMAFNRYADRNIDKINPRTAIREIPAEVIKPKSALFFVVLNVVLFIGVTFFINRLVFYLSPIALVIVLGYSYTKRFTSLAHLVLGLGLSLSPIGAYLAVTGKFDVLPVIYSFIVLFWVAGFDIIYALQDEEFDKSQNLKSIPVFLGKNGALNFSSFLHTLTIVFVVVAGIIGNGQILYWTGAIIFVALLIYQHFLVKPTDLSKVDIAFFTTNGIASVVFAGFVIADLLVF